MKRYRRNSTLRLKPLANVTLIVSLMSLISPTMITREINFYLTPTFNKYPLYIFKINVAVVYIPFMINSVLNVTFNRLS